MNHWLQKISMVVIMTVLVSLVPPPPPAAAAQAAPATPALHSATDLEDPPADRPETALDPALHAPAAAAAAEPVEPAPQPALTLATQVTPDPLFWG